jgi:alpha/beta superfamily hydrolase/putative sterol carrier protein
MTPSPKHVRDYFLGYLLSFKGEALLSRLRGIDIRVGFNIESQRENSHFLLTLVDGAIEEVEENQGALADIVYHTEEETFWRVVGGYQRAESAFLRGRIRIRGNLLRGLKLAFLLQEFFDRFPYRHTDRGRYDDSRELLEAEFVGYPEDVIEERIRIGEKLDIKAAYHEENIPTFSAVLVPPHPFLGGTSDNRLLLTLSSALASAGGFVVRFDYRLTNENSDSEVLSFWEKSDTGDRMGMEELSSVHRWISAQEVFNGIPLLWIGYSYGAQVCLWAADHLAPDKIVLISPVASQIGEERNNLRTSTLLIGGTEDFATHETEFSDLAESLSTTPKIRVIEGADHFYLDKENNLIDALLDFLAFPSCAPTGRQL